jgi:hypothetical protein
VGHHRYIATFDIIIVDPSEPDTGPTLPMPNDLVQQVVRQINAGLNTTKPNKGGKSFDVGKVEKK